jgi:Spx/MgsR family transcriptional regulator
MRVRSTSDSFHYRREIHTIWREDVPAKRFLRGRLSGVSIFLGEKIMAKVKIRFLQKPSCTSCRKAKAFLEKHKVELDMRDLGKDRLSVEELDKLIGKRDHRTFLNTRNELYRAMKMKENPPSRDEALKLMAAEPNLIRRPVVLRGRDIVLGYDEEALKRISK